MSLGQKKKKEKTQIFFFVPFSCHVDQFTFHNLVCTFEVLFEVIPPDHLR